MKKTIPASLLLIFCSSFLTAFSQNVGIGTTTPGYKLTVKTPSNNWGFVHTDSIVTLGSYIYSGGMGGFGTRSNHPLYLFSSNTDSPPAITLAANGINVGIGTTAPAYNVDVHSAGNAQFNLREGIGSQTALFSRYTNRLEIQPSDAFEISVGGIDQRNLCISSNGFTGIGTSTPSTKFQVFTGDASYGLTHTNGTVTVGSYIGNGGGWLGTQSNHPLHFFTNNSNALMTIGVNGDLGIGTIAPVNKLQIGSMGSTGYGGNDIAFGNGTQASGIIQTSSVVQWYSTTDMALMPKGNGHGRVGINITTPTCPLDVRDYVTFATLDYAYFHEGNIGGYSFQSTAGNIAPETSIRAESNVVAQEFDAYSDARIKDIIDVSNSANDLTTLKNIQVTNYILKDKIKNGNRQFKKVIAQQVENVYPLVVSKHVDFIPNVYQLADKISKTDNGYILSFQNGHHLSKNAHKIKLLASDDNTMKQYNIISIISDKEILIDAANLPGEKVFVYGEEVNDFRTVDYEGLTTLNISATQELSKQVLQLKEEIETLKEALKQLKAK
jgi:hypothetical protein